MVLVIVMYEERFALDKFYNGYPTIHDNLNGTFYMINDSPKNVSLFIKRLNHLDKENTFLKTHNNNLEQFNRCLIRILANEGIKLDKYFFKEEKNYEK